MIKKLLSTFPESWQESLKKFQQRRQIRAGTFIPDEPEIHELRRLVAEGDSAIDVGANVGHYTLPLSECVGRSGRVFSFEPIATTFELLASNVCTAGASNVTLFNVAASDAFGFSPMGVPVASTGLANYYRAAIHAEGSHRVFCMPLDVLEFPRIKLMKVDAEGHDLQVLVGARRLIGRDKPVLIVESGMSGEVADWIRSQGYFLRQFPASPNVIGLPEH